MKFICWNPFIWLYKNNEIKTEIKIINNFELNTDCNNCKCNSCVKKEYDGANGYYWHGKCEICNKNNCGKIIIDCNKYLNKEEYEKY